MKYVIHEKNNIEVVEIKSLNAPINSVSDFLDIIVNLPAQKIIIHENMLNKDFFDLKTGLAGDILQKVSGTHIRLGIAGNFKKYKSKSLHAFIFESNKYKQVIFLDDIEEIINIFTQ